MLKKNLFSVIIPTMWKPVNFNKLLSSLQKCEYVGEIYLIDNKPKSKLKSLEKFTKITYFTTNKNNFVNPSWNIGASNAKYDYIVLCNDDILFDVNEYFELLNKNIHILDNGGFIGIHKDNINKGSSKVNIQPIKTNARLEKHSGRHWACLLSIKKENWEEIPELEVWYGPQYQILFNREQYTVKLTKGIRTKKRTTSKKYLKNMKEEKKKYLNLEKKIHKKINNIKFLLNGELKEYNVKYIGSGVYRDVYKVIDKNIVIKIERHRKKKYKGKDVAYFHNKMEFEMYKVFEDLNISNHFAKCLFLSDDTHYLIMEYANPLDKKNINKNKIKKIVDNIPDNLKKNLSKDIIAHKNIKIIDDKYVCVDYGHYKNLDILTNSGYNPEDFFIYL